MPQERGKPKSLVSEIEERSLAPRPGAPKYGAEEKAESLRSGRRVCIFGSLGGSGVTCWGCGTRMKGDESAGGVKRRKSAEVKEWKKE